MAARSYVTKDGDMIDYICWKQYNGQMTGTVEAVFNANPILEDMGPILPAGILLTLPDAPTPSPVQPSIYLWS
jgi:phage tail protein X